MKTIGLLGGMSWESTVTYYQLINRGVGKKIGGLHSAKICLYSVDFGDVEPFMSAGKWKEIGTVLCDAAGKIEAGGADFLLICTNTMHKVAPRVERSISIPILHIADAAAAEIRKQGFSRVGLLGTSFTMEQDFYSGRLKDLFGIDAVIPDRQDREKVNNIIFTELCLGKIKPESRETCLTIIEKMSAAGADAVLMACTEIPLLVQQEHTEVPLLDTTSIHATAAVELSTN